MGSADLAIRNVRFSREIDAASRGADPASYLDPYSRGSARRGWGLDDDCLGRSLDFPLARRFLPWPT